MLTLSLCKIPIQYKEGIYKIDELPDTDQDAIEFDHDTYGDVLTYYVPVGEEQREFNLYGIPKEEFLETVHAVYDKTGQLKKISAQIADDPVLVYIHYTDDEDARQKIRSFALETADTMVENICKCTDTIARLFVEYYYERDAMDIHAKLGTAAQREQIEKDYPRYKDSGDYPGNYPCDMMVEGDNTTLIVMVKCIVGENLFQYFQYALNSIEERIKEQAIDRLNKTDDFQFISMEYD